MRVEGVGRDGRSTDHMAWAVAPRRLRLGPLSVTARVAWMRVDDHGGPERLAIYDGDDLAWSGPDRPPTPCPPATAGARRRVETVRADRAAGPVGVRSPAAPARRPARRVAWWPSGCRRCSAYRRAHPSAGSSASGRSTAMGRSLRVLHRLPVAGTDAPRVDADGHRRSASRAWRPRPGAGSGDVAGLRAVVHDPELDAVSWVFPFDRKLSGLDELVGERRAGPGPSRLRRRRDRAWSPTRRRSP